MATLKERLRAIWRILKNEPRVVWTQVTWATGPLDGRPGYVCSIYLGMSDLGSLEQRDKFINPCTVGSFAPRVEYLVSPTPYIPTVKFTRED